MSDIIDYYQEYLKRLEAFISSESANLSTNEYFKLVQETQRVKMYIKELDDVYFKYNLAERLHTSTI